MILVNGEQTDHVSANDRGFHYGDGLFETMYWRHGRIRYWTRHMTRLAHGCGVLRIPVPDREVLARQVELVTGSQDEAVVKVIVTRGEGDRGYTSPAVVIPTVVVRSSSMPDYSLDRYRDGVRLRLCDTRLSVSQTLAGIKHLNRLDQVMARMEWSDPDIFDALMLDDQARVIEGTISNLFVVKDDVLITPRLDRCGVAGVMRSVVIDVAMSNDYTVLQQPLSVDGLYGSDEAFLTNSLIGILPVRACGDHTWVRGRVTQFLLHAMEKADA